MKSSWRLMLGAMKLVVTLSAMPMTMGLMKNGTGALRTLSNTSFINSGGIALPSAKCSQ